MLCNARSSFKTTIVALSLKYGIENYTFYYGTVKVPHS